VPPKRSSAAAKATATRTAAACPGVGSLKVRVEPGKRGSDPIGAEMQGKRGRGQGPGGTSFSCGVALLMEFATM
jgi:hypothetical protein